MRWVAGDMVKLRAYLSAASRETYTASISTSDGFSYMKAFLPTEAAAMAWCDAEWARIVREEAAALDGGGA